MIKLKEAQIDYAAIITQNRIAAYNDETIRFGSGENGGPPGYDSLDCTIEGLNHNPYYLIQLDNQTIGSFWLDMISTGHCELQDFVIHPDFHNKGYGTEALRLMEKMNPDITLWSLGTPHYSVRNRHLYQKAGFIETGKTDDGFIILFEKRCSSKT